MLFSTNTNFKKKKDEVEKKETEVCKWNRCKVAVYKNRSSI